MFHREGVRLLRVRVAFRGAMWVENHLFWQTVGDPRSEIVRASSRYEGEDTDTILGPLKAILGYLKAIRSKGSRRNIVQLLFYNTGFPLCMISLSPNIAADKSIRPNFAM